MLQLSLVQREQRTRDLLPRRLLTKQSKRTQEKQPRRLPYHQPASLWTNTHKRSVRMSLKLLAPGRPLQTRRLKPCRHLQCLLGQLA